jgi:hypothetical protein
MNGTEREGKEMILIDCFMVQYYIYIIDMYIHISYLHIHMHMYIYIYVSHIHTHIYIYIHNYICIYYIICACVNMHVQTYGTELGPDFMGGTIWEFTEQRPR